MVLVRVTDRFCYITNVTICPRAGENMRKMLKKLLQPKTNSTPDSKTTASSQNPKGGKSPSSPQQDYHHYPDPSFAKEIPLSREQAAEFVRSCYGDDFLAYILNCQNTETKVSKALINDRQLPDLFWIAVLDATSTLSGSPGPNIFRFGMKHGMSVTLANRFRIQRGGNVDLFEYPADQLLEEVANSLSALLPMLLVPTKEENNPRIPNITSAFLLSALIFDELQTFRELLARETAIVRFFKNVEFDKEVLEPSSSFLLVLNAPTCGGPLPLLAKSALVIDAAHRASIQGKSFYQPREVLPFLTHSIMAFRQLPTNGSSEVPALCVLQGITCADPIGCPGGQLRPPTSFERQTVLPGWLDDALIYQTNCQIKICSYGTPSEEDFFEALHSIHSQETIFEDRDRFLQDISLTRMAILLSAREEENWSSTLYGTYIFCPTHPPVLMRNMPSDFEPPSSPTSIPSDAAPEISSWKNALLSADLPEVVLKRFLSAFCERPNPADAFVDLLVALEAILGPEHEVSFQVSAAIVKIVEDDPESRGAQFKQFKKLYDLRSRIVHGDSLKAGEPEKSLLLLKSVSLKFLKRIITDRCDILDVKPSDRVKYILLQ